MENKDALVQAMMDVEYWARIENRTGQVVI